MSLVAPQIARASGSGGVSVDLDEAPIHSLRNDSVPIQYIVTPPEEAPNVQVDYTIPAPLQGKINVSLAEEEITILNIMPELPNEPQLDLSQYEIPFTFKHGGTTIREFMADIRPIRSWDTLMDYLGDRANDWIEEDFAGKAADLAIDEIEDSQEITIDTLNKAAIKAALESGIQDIVDNWLFDPDEIYGDLSSHGDVQEKQPTGGWQLTGSVLETLQFDSDESETIADLLSGSWTLQFENPVSGNLLKPELDLHDLDPIDGSLTYQTPPIHSGDITLPGFELSGAITRNGTSDRWEWKIEFSWKFSF